MKTGVGRGTLQSRTDAHDRCANSHEQRFNNGHLARRHVHSSRQAGSHEMGHHGSCTPQSITCGWVQQTKAHLSSEQQGDADGTQQKHHVASKPHGCCNKLKHTSAVPTTHPIRNGTHHCNTKHQDRPDVTQDNHTVMAHHLSTTSRTANPTHPVPLQTCWGGCARRRRTSETEQRTPTPRLWPHLHQTLC